MLIARGAVKDYDWGIVDGLQAWSGEATGEPQAELWFGVHPGGPSPLVDSSGRPTGEHLADHFDIEAFGAEGWTAQTLASHALPALRRQLIPLETAEDFFCWDPV